MATQLNPGADATLVQAAYAAAMANVPKDLSGTFEALAASYDKTMQSVADSWSGVIKDVATLGGAAVATAIKNKVSPPGYGDLIQYSSVDQLSEEKRAEIGTYADYIEDAKGGEKGYQKFVFEESGTGVEDKNILSKEEWVKGARYAFRKRVGGIKSTKYTNIYWR